MIAEQDIQALNAWLAKAGLRGEPEETLVSAFCERAVAAGLPIARAQVFIDTLHPVYEGRLVRWGHDPSRPVVQEYGRTGSPGAAADLRLSGATQSAMVARWRASPFFRMLQTGESLLRRRVTARKRAEFPILRDYRAEGMTDYVAIINRFAPENIIGEMDCIYSSWLTGRADGFADAHIAVLTRVVPTLALAFKAAALARMTGTLMETYLGRDPGRRVLSGRIMRGIADRIDAVIWFSDLRGFTRITDSAPEQIIPLLNDYADVIVSAIHAQGGDVLKLIGDGVLAIFAADRSRACLCGRAPGRDGRAQRSGGAEFAARRRRLAGHRHVPRPACRRGVLRQCRQRRAAGFHRSRPGRQRSEPDRRHVPVGRAADTGLGDLRQCRWHAQPAGLGRPLRVARGRAAARAFHAGYRPSRLDHATMSAGMVSFSRTIVAAAVLEIGI